MRSAALADTLGRLSEMGEGLGVLVEIVEAGGNDVKNPKVRTRLLL